MTITCDPQFSYDVLLCHFDGTNGSTTYTDSSSYAHGLTSVGGAVALSTVQVEFGTAALHSAGTGGVGAAIGGLAEFDLSANADFTVEGWLWLDPAGAGQQRPFFGLINQLTPIPLQSAISTAGQLSLRLFNSSAVSIAGIIGSTVLSTSAWHHIAFVRHGSTLSAYIDGALEASVAITGTPNVIDGPGFSNVMIFTQTGIGSGNGYIDEFRFSNGFARYTAPFTPTGPFLGPCVPPTIDVQPTNQSGIVGNTATFSVTAHGNDLAYQWFLNGNPILGANNSSFTTAPLTLGMSGQNYQVQIAGTIGPPATSNLVVLTVIGPPQNSYINQFLDEQIFPMTFGRKLFFEEFVYYPMRPAEDGVDLAPAVPNMIIDRYKQQPTETRKRGVDFTLFCQPGEFIVGISAAVVTPTTTPPVVVTSIIIDPDTQQKFAYTVAGGVDGTEYTIQFTVTFNTGNVQTEQVVFMIALFAESQFP